MRPSQYKRFSLLTQDAQPERLGSQSVSRLSYPTYMLVDTEWLSRQLATPSRAGHAQGITN